MNAIPAMDLGETSPVDFDALLEALPGDDPAGV